MHPNDTLCDKSNTDFRFLKDTKDVRSASFNCLLCFTRCVKMPLEYVKDTGNTP